MATSCVITGQLSMQAIYRGAEALNPSIRSAMFGGGLFPTLSRALANGTGASQANALYFDQRTVLTTANDDLDLSGVLATQGIPLVFTSIKYVLIAISAPDGTQKLNVGPKGVTNAWAGPWVGGVGATVYEEVWDWRDWSNPYSGWTVTAGTGDILRINNPSAVTVTYIPLIVGIV